MNSTAHDWQAQQAARRMVADQLILAHPHLVPVSAKINALVAAAKNIRIELARAFPGVKFAVRSSRYSGGDSIDVAWIDGPTSDQVNAIIGRYDAGSFDGMDDSYTYRADHGWTDAFGDAKYIHGNRQYSDRMLASVMGRVTRYLGGLETAPTIDQYRNGKLWHLYTAGGCDYSLELGRALQKHTYCVDRTPKVSE